MDDLMYRYNNQNSIYVLNSSFHSYGEFGRLNFIACPQLNPAVTNDERSANCPESQLSALTSYNNNNNNNGCSSVTRSLQHKLKTLGSLSTAEVIGNSGGTSSMSSSSTASSAGTCSPAAAALQKLFNCTSVASNINSCNNSGNSSSSCNMSNSNNSNGNIIRDCLSTTETDAIRDSGALLSNNGNSNSNSNSNGSSSSSNSNNNNKKKCANVKSTLIAKKTKFLKYLEEEKWRAHDDSIENLSTTNCERNRDSNNIYSNSTALRGSSTAYNTILTSSASSTTGGSFQDNNSSSSSNHYGSNKAAAALNTTQAASSSSQQQQHQQQQQQPQHQQYKSNNWSGNHDSNNQKQQKTSSELYKEAAELLGLSCTLCDNCRCLDCQSGYFDCDDSDSYSELSFMDEYDEVGIAPTTSVFMMHADYEYENDTEQQHKDYTQQQLQQQDDEEHAGHQHFLYCNGTDCNKDSSAKNAGDVIEETTTETTTMLAVAINDKLTVNISLTDNEMSNDDRCVGVKVSSGLMPSNSNSITTQPLLRAKAATSTDRVRQQLNELEHCASFNELSLMDARTQNKTHDCLWAEQQQQQQHVACGSK